MTAQEYACRLRSGHVLRRVWKEHNSTECIFAVFYKLARIFGYMQEGVVWEILQSQPIFFEFHDAVVENGRGAAWKRRHSSGRFLVGKEIACFSYFSVILGRFQNLEQRSPNSCGRGNTKLLANIRRVNLGMN